MSDNNLNTEKKKRGRKPKPKVENEEPKIPKKRGRKPKLKLISEEEKNKFILPSKRGRKPKDKTIVLNKDLNLDNISNVILHLPISLEKLEELDEELFSHILTQNSMAKIALLDWKGLGSQKQKVLDLLESTELEIIKL